MSAIIQLTEDDMMLLGLGTGPDIIAAQSLQIENKLDDSFMDELFSSSLATEKYVPPPTFDLTPVADHELVTCFVE
jgi:hypothetical protein